MNEFVIMFESMVKSNLPKVGQFGLLLEHLAANNRVNDPPTELQFNDGHNSVNLLSPLCADCLRDSLLEAGFRVVVGFTQSDGGCHDPDCNNKMVAAE